MKRAIFLGLTSIILLLAIILDLLPSPVKAATITTLSYGSTGSVVGTYISASTSNFVTFSPITAVTAGSTITLTFPSGTTLTSANLATTDFSIAQATQGLCVVGGAATVPSAISVDAANRTITLTVASGSISQTVALLGCGLGEVTISTSILMGGNEIRHPTTTTASATFQVSTSVGDSGSLSNVAFIADSASYLKITGSATQTVGTNNELTITAYDQYQNVATGYTGSKSLTFSGLANSPNNTIPTVEGINLGSGTTISFASGISNANTATLIAYKVETASLDATDGSINTAGSADYDLDITISVGAASSLTKNSGDSQSASVNTSLTNNLVAKLTDAYGNPVSSATVSFSISAYPNGASGQSLTTTSASTDTSGLASSSLTVGNTAGAYQVQAEVSGVGTVTFSATATDSTAPTISDLVVNPSSTSVAVTWNTNELASTKINYGLTAAYGSNTSETDTSPRVTSHSQTITGLLACARYHLRVVSTDYSTNQTNSSDQTFTTTGCLGSSAVLDQSAASITTAGGSTSLMSSGTGISLTIPNTFASNDAEFQIKKLNRTAVFNTAPLSSLTNVGDYVYELDAFGSPTTKITSFNQPITITISYALADVSNINASSMKIYRWNGSSWSELSVCSVNQNNLTVSCTTTAFSVFILAGQTNTVSANNSTATSTSNTSPAATPQCSDLLPGGAPWLYAGEANNDSQIVLYFTDANDPITHYVLEYGTAPSNYQFSAQNIGGKGKRTFTVDHLDPNTTYYFRLRAGNNCATGSWSNELGITTKAKSLLKTKLTKTSTTAVQPLGDNQAVICEPKYLVKTGDTFWNIAQNNLGQGADYVKILAINSLSESDLLHVDQVINIPCPTEQPPVIDAATMLDTYQLKIKLIDHQGRPLKKTNVILHSEPKTGLTNDNGEVIFSNVEPGNHELEINNPLYQGRKTIFVAGENEEIKLQVQLSPPPFLVKFLIGTTIVFSTMVLFLLLSLLKTSRTSERNKLLIFQGYRQRKS